MLKCHLELRGTAGLSVGSLWVCLSKWPLSTFDPLVCAQYAALSISHVWKCTHLISFNVSIHLTDMFMLHCFSVSELLVGAVLLTCVYHFKQPEASTSSNPVSAIFPRQICCHGECMPFLCGCHGDPVLQPSSRSHHVSALSFVCLLFTNALKINISSTGECPQGLPSGETSRGIPDAASVQLVTKKYHNGENDSHTVTLHVWQWKYQMYENNSEQCRLFFVLTCEPIAMKGTNAKCLPLIW